MLTELNDGEVAGPDGKVAYRKTSLEVKGLEAQLGTQVFWVKTPFPEALALPHDDQVA